MLIEISPCVLVSGNDVSFYQRKNTRPPRHKSALDKPAHKMKAVILSFTIASLFFLGTSEAKENGPPPARKHTAIQSHRITPVPANVKPVFQSIVSVTVENGQRKIKSNGIPTHLVGRFPNCGNPHSISRQRHSFSMPLNPRLKEQITELESGWVFGVAINGVPFEPLAAEWYLGARNSIWRYEALGGAVNLGVDENYAHVQPGGKYHYHGLPIGLLKKLGASEGADSVLVGWAADGFPIYGPYIFRNGVDSSSGLKEMRSSYRLKTGARASDSNAPGGLFDGAFVNDFYYVDGLHELDQCNGAFLKTPEFPKGTYAYFLSKDWPIIPRCFRGRPDSSFNKRGRGRHAKPGKRPADC